MANSEGSGAAIEGHRPFEANLFEGGSYAVRFNRVSCDAFVVVVFDLPAAGPGLDKPFWGEDFFARSGVNVIGVTARSNDWHVHPEIDGATRAIRLATSHMETVGLGIGVGGSAAIHHADALGLKRLVAVAPTFSPTWQRLPSETRFADVHQATTIPLQVVDHQRSRVKGYVVYDSLAPNAQQRLELIARFHDLSRVVVPFSRDRPLTMLAEVGLLEEALLGMLRGTLAVRILRRQLRQRRGASPTYTAEVGYDLLKRCQPAGALAMFKRASEAAAPPRFHIDRSYAHVLASQARAHQAAKILERWLGDAEHHSEAYSLRASLGTAAGPALAGASVTRPVRIGAATLFEGQRYRVRFNRVSDEPFCVVVFDPGGDPKPMPSPTFWGENFFGQRGINAAGVSAKVNDGYAQPEIEDALRAILLATAGIERVGYGPSMGGYGALNHAEALGLTRVVAVAPSFSPNPEKVPYDGRFRHTRVDHSFPIDRLDSLNTRVFGYVMFDPHQREDSTHVELITRCHDLLRVIVPLSGHDPLKVTSEAGILEETLLLMLRGLPTPSSLRLLLRRRRQYSPTYLAEVGYALLKRRHRLGALAMFERARAATSKPLLHVDRSYAQLLAATGRIEEAIGVLDRWADDPATLEASRELHKTLASAVVSARTAS